MILGTGASTAVAVAAHHLRLRLDIRIAADAEASRISGLAALPGDSGAEALVWQPGQSEPEFLYAARFDGATEISQWLRVRSVPLLGSVATLDEDEPYEDLKLPIARLFLEGGNESAAVDSEAVDAVTDVAARFLGRVAFIVRDSGKRSHEWRHHGLPPGRFPAFGFAVSMVHNATKYAFLQASEIQGPALLSFWQGPAREELAAFVEDALAGRLAPSPMSELPENGVNPLFSPGIVLKLVGRQCREVVEASPTEALVEVYDEWRRDHETRTSKLDVLATMLARWNITVYRLDFGYNECPPQTLPLIPAGYSGYFYMNRMAKDRGKKWHKLKKFDPPFDRVLSFVEKHTEIFPRPNLSTLLEELEARTAAVGKEGGWLPWDIEALMHSNQSGFALILGSSIGLVCAFALAKSLDPRLHPNSFPFEDPLAEGGTTELSDEPDASKDGQILMGRGREPAQNAATRRAAPANIEVD